MTLPGGPAAKYGHEYERLWTIWQLVRILQGRAEAIRIEDPNLPQTEFWVDAGGRRELHQAKRQHSSGKWTLSSVGESLTRAIGRHLRGNRNHFVFASGSDTPELRSLCDAANDAESVEEFLTVFLKSKTRRAAFQKLRNWWDCDDPTAVDFLSRIEVRSIDQAGLEEQVRSGLPALFLAKPEEVVAVLARIVDKSVHRKWTRESLVEHLLDCGYRLRRVTNSEDAVRAIECVTDDYRQGARSRLIRGKMLPRSTTNAVLEHIQRDITEDGRGTDIVILGAAGSGKTACVVDLVDRLQAEGLPTLAFRLDKVPPSAWKTTDLGSHLGLDESPALVLSAAAEAVDRPGVLIVDQLDAVSKVSGRNHDALDLVRSLVNEARSGRARARLHTVIVCRIFDWNNDSHLRRLAPRADGKPTMTEFTITELTTQEVRDILTEAEFRPALFQPGQLELLRLPQNLSIFLDAGFDPSRAPSFDTATRLFRRYWNEKRRRVKERIVPRPDEWTSVVETLCGRMTDTQQLSVPLETLDRFQPEYVASMVSEGVISFDERRYRFGHESFFDYCFARQFVARQTSLRSFLTGSRQDLFRRAQVRQVLAYLRDSDFNRYVKELRQLLEDDDIRAHIKDLVLALLAEVPDPTEDEWTVWEKQIGPEVEAIAEGTTNGDCLSALARRRLFGSRSWFPFLDDTGVIKGWLESGNDRLVDLAVDYLDLHQRHHPDRVAATLEPYVDVGGDWVRRFRRVVLYARYGTSRRFIDLLLRLLDNGVLDEDCKPGLENQALDGVFHGLADRRPEWVPEILAHRLRRRVAVIRAAEESAKRGALLGYREYATQALGAAVERVPGRVVKHLLPIVLEIADSEAIDDTRPRADAVWGRYMIVDATSHEAALLSGLATALADLADAGHGVPDDVVTNLRTSDTHAANHLLLALYGGGGARYADEAIALLCDQPWRLQCGYPDNPKWCAMELIRAIAPHCNPRTLARLEELLLTYRSPFEKTPTGFRFQGKSRLDLLSTIPAELRSARANSHFRELTRKFGKPASEPKPVSGGFVVSPIPSEATAKMTNDQWLRAITMYSSDFPRPTGDDFLKGGAVELSRELGARTKEDPERFARLALRIPADAQSVYIEAILGALEEEPLPSELKMRVCEKAFCESREYHGRVLADVIGHMEERFPDAATEMLSWLAIESNSPTTHESWNASGGRDDIYAHGINTTRGRAAQAIQRLIVSDAAYVERFRPTIERMIRDPHPAVLSCVAGVIRAIWHHDPDLGMRLFKSMDLTEPRLLATPHMYDLLHHVVRKHLAVGHPLVQRMLRSADTDVGKAGGRLASLAALYHDSAVDLAAKARDGDVPHRLGIAQVASSNVKYPQCREWCEENLVVLFDDDDASVRHTAAGCFEAIGDDPLEGHGDLISCFCESRAFPEHADALVRVLKNSPHRLPGLTCDVCERFLDRLTAASERSRYLVDVPELVFRTYQHHLNDDYAKRALDLVDRLCLAGDGGARERLEEFER